MTTEHVGLGPCPTPTVLSELAAPHGAPATALDAILQQQWKVHLQDLAGLFEPGTATRERLQLFQAIRARGVLPAAAGFFLVAACIEAIGQERLAASMRHGELQTIGERMEAIKRAHGLAEFEDFDPDEAPAEYRALDAAWTRWDEGIVAATFGELGDDEMVALYLNDRDAYHRRFIDGCRFFCGPETDPP
jgi:hypothetical protein